MAAYFVHQEAHKNPLYKDMLSRGSFVSPLAAITNQRRQQLHQPFKWKEDNFSDIQ